MAEASQQKSEIGPVHTLGLEANPCFSNRSMESRKNTTPSGIIPGSTSAAGGASRKKKWRCVSLIQFSHNKRMDVKKSSPWSQGKVKVDKHHGLFLSQLNYWNCFSTTLLQ